MYMHNAASKRMYLFECSFFFLIHIDLVIFQSYLLYLFEKLLK